VRGQLLANRCAVTKRETMSVHESTAPVFGNFEIRNISVFCFCQSFPLQHFSRYWQSLGTPFLHVLDQNFFCFNVLVSTWFGTSKNFLAGRTGNISIVLLPPLSNSAFINTEMTTCTSVCILFKIYMQDPLLFRFHTIHESPLDKQQRARHFEIIRHLYVYAY